MRGPPEGEEAGFVSGRNRSTHRRKRQGLSLARNALLQAAYYVEPELGGEAERLGVDPFVVAMETGGK